MNNCSNHALASIVVPKIEQRIFDFFFKYTHQLFFHPNHSLGGFQWICLDQEPPVFKKKEKFAVMQLDTNIGPGEENQWNYRDHCTVANENSRCLNFLLVNQKRRCKLSSIWVDARRMKRHVSIFFGLETKLGWMKSSRHCTSVRVDVVHLWCENLGREKELKYFSKGSVHQLTLIMLG